MFHIIPDKRIPMYKPLTGWKLKVCSIFKFPCWLMPREFCFFTEGKKVYCNPDTYKILLGKFYGA
jgi:hypothetical protein